MNPAPIKDLKRVIVLITFLFSLAFVWPFLDVKASVRDEITARNQQIEQIQKQIDDYQQQIDANSSKAQTLAGEIGSLNAQISKVTLEIKSLALSINQTTAQIGETQGQIAEDQIQIDSHKKALAKYIQILDQVDQQNLTVILLRNPQLSDFFGNLKNIEDTQNNLRTTIVTIKKLQAGLEQKESDLQDQKVQQISLKSLQDSEKIDLSQTKKQKDSLLKETKGQEAKFQQLVKQSKEDIARISDQITYLEQNGVTVEDAIKFGQLAALRLGIRPAYLIAVLEAESRMGVNVGKCNRADDPPEKSWRVIMNPRDFSPFAAITAQLGLNPDTTAVSCPQYVSGRQFGWGGAMGPAQFIPSTWVGYADKVAQIVGRSIANPWNIEDAFMAAAVKLANAGATAKTRAAEVAASKAYYSGNSKCSKAQCNSYASTIQNKAAIIEQNL